MDYIIGAYCTNWSIYRNESTPWNLPCEVTHAFYAFLRPNAETGKVEHIDEWADLQKPLDLHETSASKKGAIAALLLFKDERPGFKAIVSIGGWGTNAEFQAMAKDDVKQRNFVESTLELVQKHRFDGVDIDWEYPLTPEEGNQLVTLLRRLRAGLDSIEPSLILSIAAPAGDEQTKVLDIKSMDEILTFWNVMCYDFAGCGWSEKVGYHSNLYSHNGDNTLNAHLVIRGYTRRGASANKLVLGMPGYARAFPKPLAKQVGAKFKGTLSEDASTVDFIDVCRCAEKFDGDHVAARSYDVDKDTMLTYDNEKCAYIKGEYVAKNGLAGGFWWDSHGNYDKNDLIRYFVSGLTGK